MIWWQQPINQWMFSGWVCPVPKHRESIWHPCSSCFGKRGRRMNALQKNREEAPIGGGVVGKKTDWNEMSDTCNLSTGKSLPVALRVDSTDSAQATPIKTCPGHWEHRPWAQLKALFLQPSLLLQDSGAAFHKGVKPWATGTCWVFTCTPLPLSWVSGESCKAIVATLCDWSKLQQPCCVVPKWNWRMTGQASPGAGLVNSLENLCCFFYRTAYECACA